MLQAIRDKVTGWIAYGIIFLISIPFALWGVNSYFGTGEAITAATVNGDEISIRQFDQAYSNYRQRLIQLFGGAIPEALGTESVIRAQVLEQLIEETALRQYIEQRRYRISDEALAQRIRDMNEFKIDDQFDAEIYNAQLRSVGLSPVAFEQQLRLSASMEQFQNALRATSFVTPASRKQYANLQNQTRKIRSLKYRLDPSSVQVEDAEVEQYYRENPGRYRTAEQVKIDFVEVGLEKIKQNIVVDEADVEARYQEGLSSYTTPEYREASHILIQINDETDEATALATINGLRDRIENGESFADLAQEFSEDPVSAAEGGSLGEIGRGEMVPTFESALFALQVDELSEPVKTAFGWHLILVKSITGGEVQSFDSVRSALADEIKTELAEVQIYELVEGLANLAYEQPDSLQPAADQLGFKVQTSDWFDRANGTGIASDARVRQVAFSDEILEQGLNSEAIELDSEHVVFVRVNERKPAQALPLDEVRDQVKAELIRQKLAETSLQAGVAALARLNAGETLEDIAADWSVAITDHGFVKRNQEQLDASILQKSFTMAKPDQGLVYDGLATANGEYALVELSAVISNDAELDPGIVEGLQRSIGGAEYQAALGYLGSRAEVVKTPLDEIEDTYSF
jgi:peptidyl-prolyl cis-trans isomerase D